MIFCCTRSRSKKLSCMATRRSGNQTCENRINIDTGAYATGRLTCLKLEQDKIFL